MKIDIGSGRSKLAGYTTVDSSPKVNADITADFWNLDLTEVDEIRVHHFLEHLPAERKLEAMNKLHSMLKVGGILDIEVPKFPHPASIQDPTHISFWSKESFWYFTKDNNFGEAFAKRAESPLFKFIEDWERGDWGYGIKLKKI